MTNSLQPFLKLLQHGGNLLASDVGQAVGEPAFTALMSAGLLESGPPATSFHCHRAAEGCSRRIIPYDGQGPYDVMAVPPQGSVCCEHLCLVNDDIRTLRLSMRTLAAMLGAWLGIRVDLSRQFDEASAVALGQLDRLAPLRRVFFVRRFSGRDTMAWIEALDQREPAVVVLLTCPAELAEAVKPSLGQTTILLLDNFLHVEDSTVRLRPVSPEVFIRPSAVVSDDPTRPFCRVITETGARDAAADEYAACHVARYGYDLFLDTTTSVRGGFSGNRRFGSNMESFELSIHETAMLLELVEANGRALTPDRMTCVQRAGITDPMRKARDLRRKADFRLGRDRFRVIQSHTNSAGLVAQFSFRAPPGFRFAILVPLTDGFENSSDAT